MSIIKLYNGSGFDGQTFEYFNFMNRPVRNIVKKGDEFNFELYVREKKKWVRTVSPDEPELVGTSDDVDVDMFKEPGQHKHGDDVAAKLQHPSAKKLNNSVTPRMNEVFRVR